MKKSEVINALKEEKMILQRKIKAINAALIGFGVEGEESSYELESNSVVDKNVIPEVNSNTSNESKSEGVAIPKEYSKYASWQMKIAYVLTEFPDGAVVDQITDRILEYEQDLDKKKTYSAVTQHASRMFRDEEIDAVRAGRKYMYRIKQ